MRLFPTPALSPLLLASLAVIALLLPATNMAQNSPFGTGSGRLPVIRSSVLPVDEAFSMNALIEAPDNIVLVWEILEGYYLYRKSISVTDNDGNSVSVGEFPTAVMINDEFFGDSQVYHDRLILRFPLANLSMENDTVEFTLQYQGCAEDLYCYPMQVKEVELRLPLP